MTDLLWKSQMPSWWPLLCLWFEYWIDPYGPMMVSSVCFVSVVSVLMWFWFALMPPPWTYDRTLRACFSFVLCFFLMVARFYGCLRCVSCECVCASWGMIFLTRPSCLFYWRSWWSCLLGWWWGCACMARSSACCWSLWICRCSSKHSF